MDGGLSPSHGTKISTMSLVAQQYNYPAAFVAFCNGHPLPEIAEVLGIPEKTLRAHISNEKWVALRDQLPLSTTSLAAVPVPTQQPGRNPFAPNVLMGNNPSLLPAEMQKKLQVLADNRKTNFDHHTRLRNHLEKIISELEAGTLEFEQIVNAKGIGPTTVHRQPNMQDMVALATYAKMVQDMGYRALGDVSATEGGKQDAGVNSGAPPAITIVLPGAISVSRSERSKIAEEARRNGVQIVDIEAEKVKDGEKK